MGIGEKYCEDGYLKQFCMSISDRCMVMSKKNPRELLHKFINVIVTWTYQWTIRHEQLAKVISIP